MDETDRKNYRLSSEDMAAIITVQDSMPVMGLTARVSKVWEDIGLRMGFDYMSVRAPLEGNDPYVVSAVPLDIVTPIEKVAEALRKDSKNMIVGTILVPEQCLELYMNNGEEDVWYQVTVTKVELDGE